MFRLFSTGPAALKCLTSLSGALTKSLDVKARERIALAVAQVNGCNYYLSVHPKADAAVHFAATVTETRGHVSDPVQDLYARQRLGAGRL